MEYEVYAIRYAHHERRAAENFLGGDPHDAPMPLDYFVWAIIGGGKTYVVDTGFGAEQARLRKRELLRSPLEGLKAIGVDPDKVEDVIITHMHYDHAGGLDLFPNAAFHIQEREMAFATGRPMCHHAFSDSLAVDDVVGMVQRRRDARRSCDAASARVLAAAYRAGPRSAGREALSRSAQRSRPYRDAARCRADGLSRETLRRHLVGVLAERGQRQHALELAFHQYLPRRIVAPPLAEGLDQPRCHQRVERIEGDDLIG